MIRYTTILSVIIIAWQGAFAQPVGIRIVGNTIVCTLNSNLPLQEQEAIINNFGLNGLSIDSLWRFGSLGKWSAEGWKVQQNGKGNISVYKPLSELSGKVVKGVGAYMPNEMTNLIAEQTKATFGVNNFKKETIKTLPHGKTRFYVNGRKEARSVYLSGTFNEWSTMLTPMTRVDSGWVADVILNPGKHCYKFIADGNWFHDNQNRLQEEDGHGGYNSIYFTYNYTFVLKEFLQAKEVIVTGSFNDWNEKKLKMSKTREGWALPVFLKEGTHNYKFIVDGRWITDPGNPKQRDDGFGNINSVIELGETLVITLKGFSTAKNVFVTGNFNDWRDKELKMKQTTNGWELPLTLASGNYEYKFVVDGNWINDPDNQNLNTESGNSFLCFNPNHTFTFKTSSGKFTDVKVAGNFNGWNSVRMTKVNDGWKLDVYLPSGKCLYKFIVDGNWILDPANDQWEDNEFHNGNSVLWISANQ
ncbi:hypothetical protein SanaruYs_35250 [Chryseotalea sanaruensis]|uniref:AMP-activated protein kinase glycogen-binding domain-containing protein n=1 Tax=Chryseotalea sanaruensis TaxID=2482724 RepID=A0A401UEJ4_9BACT|nr:glycogen-binding domain-containing protein [Chryseotalea sanaruensis]GCC53282.1 hypothetical protein SanaruYs_35250 [Chryseotalea sanaruensis]